MLAFSRFCVAHVRPSKVSFCFLGKAVGYREMPGIFETKDGYRGPFPRYPGGSESTEEVESACQEDLLGRLKACHLGVSWSLLGVAMLLLILAAGLSLHDASLTSVARFCTATGCGLGAAVLFFGGGPWSVSMKWHREGCVHPLARGPWQMSDFDSPDGRSASSIAYSWTSRIIGVCLEMIIPCLLGNWLDRMLGWSPWLTLLGLLFGMWLGAVSLMRFVGASGQAERSQEDRR